MKFFRKKKNQYQQYTLELIYFKYYVLLLVLNVEDNTITEHTFDKVKRIPKDEIESYVINLYECSPLTFDTSNKSIYIDYKSEKEISNNEILEMYKKFYKKLKEDKYPYLKKLNKNEKIKYLNRLKKLNQILK